MVNTTSELLDIILGVSKYTFKTFKTPPELHASPSITA